VQQTNYSNNALLGVYTITKLYWKEGKPAIFGEKAGAGRQLLNIPVLGIMHMKYLKN